MEKRVCNFCGKVIEGFSEKDVDYRMFMHKIKHKDQMEIKEVKKEEEENGRNNLGNTDRGTPEEVMGDSIGEEQ